jgi:hypothetical protein
MLLDVYMVLQGFWPKEITRSMGRSAPLLLAAAEGWWPSPTCTALEKSLKKKKEKEN